MAKGRHPANQARPQEERDRAEERRRQILDAAATVFARRGYHQALVRDIAAAANVAQGTIYLYYPSKRDLLLALIQRIITDSLPDLPTSIDSDTPRAWLAAVLHDRFDMLDRNRDLIQAVVPEMLTDATLQREYVQQVVYPFVNWFLPLAQEVFQAAQLRPFNSRVVLSAMVAGIVFAYIVNDSDEFPIGQAVSRDELIDELMDFFFHGLGRRNQTSGPDAS